MKKICFVVNSRANYARIKTTIQASKANKNFETFVIVGASGLLFNYGRVEDIIKQDGIEIDYKVYSSVSGDFPESMAKTTGLAIIELSTIFAKINPDFVVSVADRFETLGTVIAASYMNIPVIHTQGGEISGSIDESVRHACTKLSHIHFPATFSAGKVIEQLGENPANVFVTGCPSIDIAKTTSEIPISEVLKKYRGVGIGIEPTKPYLLISQHPVTTDYKNSSAQATKTLDAIVKLGIQVIWLWPNIDSGSDSISKVLREYREKEQSNKITFYRNFSAEDYIRVLRSAACILGNSSSGIRESAYLGVPSVVIGDRQLGREHADNVRFTNYDSEQIIETTRMQVSHGKYKRSTLFGDGSAGVKMISILESLDIKVQKTFFRK
jgi:UDP-hydrolysing UDP-N-acetyl-D-glucosamine 2-epimerase